MREIVASESERPTSHRGVHTRARIGSFLLHCADISNATKPFAIAAHWTDRIMTYVREHLCAKLGRDQ